MYGTTYKISFPTSQTLQTITSVKENLSLTATMQFGLRKKKPTNNKGTTEPLNLIDTTLSKQAL